MKQLMGAAVAVALLLAGCGSGGTKTVTVTSTSSSAPSTSATSSSATTSTSGTGTTPPTTTTSTASAATTTVNIATFKSPSGNIGCMIIGGTVRCDIRQRKWSPPPRPSSCPNIVDFGQGLIVDRSGAGRLVCAGDTVMDPSAAPLPYGTVTAVDGFQCTSASDGMTCTYPASGHGFFIAIQGYRAF